MGKYVTKCVIPPLFQQLLHPDPNKRLASLEKARPHSFFSDLDWDKVFNLETTPPYVPSVSVMMM